MPTSQQLPLYHKLYQLIKFLYGIRSNFAKEYKYTFGDDVVVLAWGCIDLFLEANSGGKEKYLKISMLSVEFDKLKLRLRMGQELKLISIGQFAHLQENFISDSGRMIGGWLKENFAKA
ncbi:MAG: four helix bundle protein [Patescibacteria group bacterium]